MINSNLDYKKETPIEPYPLKGKIVIEESFESQIRYMCDRFPDNEWSGVLFYKVTGSLENNDLEISAKTFYLMDIGSGTYTEFELGTDPSIAKFMVDNDLFDCHMGLIHSHDTMAAFFSGTDTATLRKEGALTPNFVSLVVNNAGKYVAAVTNKVTILKKGMRCKGYTQFGDKWKFTKEEPFEEKSEVVEIYSLTVDKKSVKENYLVERIKEIQEEKKKSKFSWNSTSPTIYSPTWRYKDEPKEEKKEEKKSVTYGNLWDDVDETYGYDKDYPVDADDFDLLVMECANNILYAPSNLTPDVIVDSAKELVETYAFRSNNEKFAKAIRNEIEECKKLCAKEGITWTYLFPFIKERVEMFFDEDLSSNMSKGTKAKLKNYCIAISNLLDESMPYGEFY